jgi:hypothetical protein
LKDILRVMRPSAKFLEDPGYVPRTGYQRRNLGFMCERLFSHLLLSRMESGASERNLVKNIVISDGPVISLGA